MEPPQKRNSEASIISEEATKEKERSIIAYEESLVESRIFDLITDKNWKALQPNSGHSVQIRDSHVCLNYHVEKGFRVWEWQGHWMQYGNGEYSPEFICGHYFEPLVEDQEVSRQVGIGPVGLDKQRMMLLKFQAKHSPSDGQDSSSPTKQTADDIDD